MDSEEKVQNNLVRIKSLLNSIPLPHHRVLHFICLFLREIGSYSEVTKMGVDNLAIVFASNILRPEQESESSSFSFGSLETILRVFINYVDELFESSTESSEDMEGTHSPKETQIQKENWMEDLIKFCSEEDTSQRTHSLERHSHHGVNPAGSNCVDNITITNKNSNYKSSPHITLPADIIHLTRSISSPLVIYPHAEDHLDTASQKRKCITDSPKSKAEEVITWKSPRNDYKQKFRNTMPPTPPNTPPVTLSQTRL